MIDSSKLLGRLIISSQGQMLLMVEIQFPRQITPSSDIDVNNLMIFQRLHKYYTNEYDSIRNSFQRKRKTEQERDYFIHFFHDFFINFFHEMGSCARAEQINDAVFAICSATLDSYWKRPCPCNTNHINVSKGENRSE